MKRTWAAGIAILATAAAAEARPSAEQVQSLEKMVGTMQVVSEPAMSEGRLMGCQLVFDAIIQDYTYHDGAFAKVSGSATLMSVTSPTKKMGTSIKVVVEVLDPASVAPVLTPTAPTRAYLMGKNYKTNLDSLVTAGNTSPGAWYAVYQFQPTLSIMADSMADQTMTFMFNEGGGATDIRLPIDLTVASTDDNGVRTHSQVALEQYSQCIGALSEQFK